MITLIEVSRLGGSSQTHPASVPPPGPPPAPLPLPPFFPPFPWPFPGGGPSISESNELDGNDDDSSTSLALALGIQSWKLWPTFLRPPPSMSESGDLDMLKPPQQVDGGSSLHHQGAAHRGRRRGRGQLVGGR